MSDGKTTSYVLATSYGEYVAGDGTRYDASSEVSKTEAEKLNKADGGVVFVPKYEEVGE